MKKLMLFLCSLLTASLVQSMLNLDFEITVKSSGITECKKSFNRNITLVENSTEEDVSSNMTRYITMSFIVPDTFSTIDNTSCGNITLLNLSDRIRLSLTLQNLPQHCCVKQFPSSCSAINSSSRMFCENKIIETTIRGEDCGLNISEVIRNRTRSNRINCSSQQLPDIHKRICRSRLVDDDDDDEDDPRKHFRSLSNFRQNLCVGNLARNIQKGLRLARMKKRGMDNTDYEVVLDTLDFTFQPSFAGNWKNRKASDTKDMVDTTEELLNQLVTDRQTFSDDYFYGASNLAYNVIRLQSSIQERFSFPSNDKKLNFTILKEASVNFSIDEGQSKDCSITIGVSIINADYVDYVQETIRMLDDNDTREPVSTMLSIVVLNSNESDENCVNFQQSPITLTFTPQAEILNNFTYTGYFLNITDNTIDWSTEGLTTHELNNGSIVVETTHLTSFAVLVSPNMFSPTLSDSHQEALNVVSYVGCAISIVSLILTIICLLIFREKLKKGVLLYVHLNLAVSLLCALLVFVFGVDLASTNEVLCKIVASLIQYFFLCAFLWMLGEGIMLYVLLVKVFGNVADRWYLLIPICWGIPIPVVSVSGGLLHHNYLTTNGNKTYCWIKADPSEPAIWTFVGPVILITSINTIILLLTIGSILKTRIYVRKITEKNNSTFELVKVTLKGSVILLPLLGVTWLLGIFAVNSNTVVFAWLFTVVNSLQGCLIFLIHVLRNDYIWGKVKKTLRIKQIQEKVTTSQFFTASASNGSVVTTNGKINQTTATVSDFVSLNKKDEDSLSQ